MSTFSGGPDLGFEISNLISTQVNGIEIEGVMTGCSYDIDVEIMKPFQNLITGSHIPVFARSLSRSFKSEYGEIRAREMLTHLFLIGQHVSQNQEKLIEKLAVFRKRIAGLPEEQSWELEDQFFDDNFPMLIGMGTRLSVFDILSGEKTLSIESS